ncbi:type 3 dihydrofolate reductase [Paraglaciecola marina]|uniref:type 3 dihydrofolate reductase n=1 Tax=Paraglaciecola marina TaxID=2500157 RepID=UPI001EF0353B|nr:type 3 dihydrofolate reductase [Paraglaciecola marina]
MIQVSMIAAMANDRVIGFNNTMPWHLPADLKHFKKVTLGKPIVMGRKTYESIGKALPGRLNIVVSSDPVFTLPDATVVNSCEQAIEEAKGHSQAEGVTNPEVMIIGGGTIYQHFLPLCHRLYLTHIDLEVAGDTYFPDYKANYSWVEESTESFDSDDKNLYSYHFINLVKQAELV